MDKLKWTIDYTYAKQWCACYNKINHNRKYIITKQKAGYSLTQGYGHYPVGVFKLLKKAKQVAQMIEEG